MNSTIDVNKMASTIGNLTGKVALITGASSGIGAATAKLFSKLGASLALTGRKEDNLRKVGEECKRLGNKEPLLVPGDLVSEEDTKRIVETTIKHYNGLNILVNCAGILELGTIETTSLEQYDRMFNINVRSIYHLTMLATPHIIKSKGNIVNVSSVNGMRSFPNVLAYCMSKSAIDQFTRCVALELAPKGVRVNSVNPGVTVTELQKRGGLSDEAYEKFLERSKETHALGRPGNPEEVVLDNNETSVRLSALAGTGDSASSSTGPSATECSDYERKVHTGSAEFMNALKRLNETLTEENLEALKTVGEKSEKDDIVVGVGLHLIKKLTGNCIVDKAKSEIICPCGCKGNIESSNKMWIGSPETLHGELDMIVEGVGIVVAENLCEDDIHDKDVETEDLGDETQDGGGETKSADGGTKNAGGERSKETSRQLERQSVNDQRVNLDLKKCVKNNLYQIISQTIVFGWTEYNMHRELSPYIPTVFIDSKQFGIAVYNPIKDSLLLTRDCVPFFGGGPNTKYSGIFILWLIMHHRLFFKNKLAVDFECKFKKQVDVKNYEQLKSYSFYVRDNTDVHKFGITEGFSISKRKHSETD